MFRPAGLSSFVEGDLLALNEAVLPEVLLALLLLLGLVVGDVGGVASPVVAVVALDNFIILRLLDHLDLVNASFAVAAGPGLRHLIEADAITVAGILSEMLSQR